MEITIAARSCNILGEGIVWSALTKKVLWTDIMGKKLWSLDPVTRASSSIDLSERLACLAPTSDGSLLAGFDKGLGVQTGGTAAVRWPIEQDQPTTRLNDGRLDREGRFVFGTMDESETGPEPIANIWSFDGSSPPRKLLSGMKITNSLAFSPDGRTMYVADTPTRTIWAYDYSAEGIATNGRLFVEVDADGGYPDGSTVDGDGYLWNCEWEGHRVVRYDPRGRVDRFVELPVSKPTCCAFGGDDLSTLFITSARHGMTEDQIRAEPEAGSLLSIVPGVRGIADTPFKGALAR
jgi:L-arabinonolactonase